MVHMKTSLSWILLAKVLSCLAYGKVQVRQITPERELYVVKNPATHELTCISEDDDAALVWNYDFNTSEPFDHFDNFDPVKPMKGISLDSECAVWRSNGCLTKWRDWTKLDPPLSNYVETVSSLTNPMAPVVDYRWEGFKEYVAKNKTPVKVLQLNRTDGTVVFSIRGTQNVEIHLCQREELRTSLCYLIKLAVDGKYSVIEKCHPMERQCQEKARSATHESAILDAHGWRTFRLQLISREQKMKVFRDVNENAFLEGNLRESQSINSIWISSGPVARIRFHTYNYTRFTKKYEVSSTSAFYWPDNHLCINMLVSICPLCQVLVILYGGSILSDEYIYGDEQFHQNGLRTWRTVTFNFSLSGSSPAEYSIHFKPNFDGSNHEDMWWAIDNLRVCEPNDGVRKSTITPPFSDHTGPRVNIKCQKLLRNVTVVADSGNRLPLQNTGRLGEYIQQLVKFFPSNNTAECNDTSEKYLEEKTVKREARAPGLIRDLRFESISATSVTGKWNRPDQINGAIRNYTVSIKRVELIGCRYYGKPSPAESEIMKNVTSTTASFSDLHPYAKYQFQVIANTIEPGPAVLEKFETAQLYIPTSNVSNLQLINESCLAWDGPADCTTITGTTRITKLLFWGVSEWAKDWSFNDSTAHPTYVFNKFKLLPYTKYRVCAYVVRNYHSQENLSNCQPYAWRTKPVAPPAVRNIEIYEADFVKITISVKWEPPYPPTGKIESYQLSIKNGDKIVTSWLITVSALKKCGQSHFCVENLSLPSDVANNDNLTLQIFAKNANVTTDGDIIPKKLMLDNLYDEAPGQPEQLEVTPREYGTVTLRWSHPSFTPTKIVRFQIRADCLRTNLTNHPCKNILPIYYNIANPEEESHSTELYLLTSTEYCLYVAALNDLNRISAPITKNVSTSGSVSFASQNELRVINAINVVALEVPAVLNATRYTTIVIKVEGSSLCAPNSSRNESSSKNETNITMDWDAVKYSVNRGRPVNFTFELNKYYGVEQNCSFQRQEAYIFNAILKDPGLEKPLILKTPRVAFTNQKPSAKQSQTWLVVIPILVISLLLFVLFILYRKHKKTKMQANDSQGVSSDVRHSIPVNSRVQSSDVQDLPSDPVHTASSENSEGQTSSAQNVSLEPPYMNPRNPSEQTSHLQNVALASVYMNISNNSSEESNHAQDVPSDLEYWEILDKPRKEPSHPQDVALTSLYMNTLDNSKGESSYSRDASLDPVYMNILDCSKEQTRHAHDTP